MLNYRRQLPSFNSYFANVDFRSLGKPLWPISSDSARPGASFDSPPGIRGGYDSRYVGADQKRKAGPIVSQRGVGAQSSAVLPSILRPMTQALAGLCKRWPVLMAAAAQPMD